MTVLRLLLTWLAFSLSAVFSFIQQEPTFAVASAKKAMVLSALPSTTPPPVPNFCADCGSASMELQVPPGDERLRACCTACGRIEYSNPKVVVACVVLTDDQRCLLAKRAIEPRKGTWGIPQGFMEHGETTREAAAREVFEETGAVIEEALRLRAVYNVPGSVQLVYEARVSGVALERQLAESTLESLEVRLYSLDCIPHDDLSFPTVKWALDHCLASKDVDFVPVQQKTKYYNSELGTWSELEDECRNLNNFLNR